MMVYIGGVRTGGLAFWQQAFKYLLWDFSEFIALSGYVPGSFPYPAAWWQRASSLARFFWQTSLSHRKKACLTKATTQRRCHHRCPHCHPWWSWKRCYAWYGRLISHQSTSWGHSWRNGCLRFSWEYSRLASLVSVLTSDILRAKLLSQACWSAWLQSRSLLGLPRGVCRYCCRIVLRLCCLKGNALSCWLSLLFVWGFCFLLVT